MVQKGLWNDIHPLPLPTPPPLSPPRHAGVHRHEGYGAVGLGSPNGVQEVGGGGEGLEPLVDEKVISYQAEWAHRRFDVRGRLAKRCQASCLDAK